MVKMKIGVDDILVDALDTLHSLHWSLTDHQREVDFFRGGGGWMFFACMKGGCIFFWVSNQIFLTSPTPVSIKRPLPQEVYFDNKYCTAPNKLQETTVIALQKFLLYFISASRRLWACSSSLGKG